MGITVSDTEQSIDFYRTLTDVLVTGPLVKRGPAVDLTVGVVGAELWITFIDFQGGDALVELAEYRGSTDAPLNPVNSLVGAAHPAIVVENISETLTRLSTKGYASTASPQIASSGPLEGYRYVYVIGPDRVRVELLQAPDKTPL